MPEPSLSLTIKQTIPRTFWFVEDIKVDKMKIDVSRIGNFSIVMSERCCNVGSNSQFHFIENVQSSPHGQRLKTPKTSLYNSNLDIWGIMLASYPGQRYHIRATSLFGV